MIEDIRAIEYTVGKGKDQVVRWGLEVQRTGSKKWAPIELKLLQRKPKETSRGNAHGK